MQSITQYFVQGQLHNALCTWGRWYSGGCISIPKHCAFARLFLQSSELRPLHLLTSRRVCPPLSGEGVGGVPIQTRGQTLWYSRYICTLWYRGFFTEKGVLYVYLCTVVQLAGLNWNKDVMMAGSMYLKWKNILYTYSPINCGLLGIWASLLASLAKAVRESYFAFLYK